jgi:hypothetical protein
MSRRIFAYELQPGDTIVHEEEWVVVEESNPQDADAYVDEGTYVVGYYDVTGDPFHRFYDADASVVVMWEVYFDGDRYGPFASRQEARDFDHRFFGGQGYISKA